MRAWLLALVLLSGFTPVAQAHGADGFGHLNVDVADLAPNQMKEYHLDPSTEGEAITLREGWVFGVYAVVQTPAPARLTAGLVHEGIETQNWTWTSGAQRNTTLLHFTGEHVIRVHNPSNVTARYAFYYDQSCNCKGKLIPLPGGWNLFNYDFPKGREVLVGFPLAQTYHVRGALATLKPDSQGRWPQDFAILQEQEAQGPQWLNFTFKTASAQRHFVYVEAIAGADLRAPLQLTPLVEAKDADAPGPSVALLIVAILGLVAWARRKDARRT